MLLGVAPFGMITGASAVAVGIPAPEAIWMSLVVFAGASQLAAMALMERDAGWWAMLATVALVNARLVMYSAALAPWVAHLRRRTRMAMAYVMTDQAFAYAVLAFGKNGPTFPRRDYYVGVAVTTWTVWTGGYAVGVFVGARVPPAWNLDFAIPLTFMALISGLVKTRPAWTAALVGGGSAIALADLPYNLGLLTAAVAGVVAGTIVASVQARKPALGPGADTSDVEARDHT